jgi:hypothetical protein
MDTKHVKTIRQSLTSRPSRRDVVQGFAGAGIGLTALSAWPRGVSEIAAKKKRKKRSKNKKKNKTPQLPPSPPPFNEFGCLDVGQPCQGDSTLCCSGICDPGTSTCVAHDSGVCFADTDSCTVGQGVRCSVNNEHCGCTLTTGNAGFCTDLSNFDPDVKCRFCSTDTDCQEEFGAGAACVVLRGAVCSAACAATGRTACMTPCV